MRFAKSISIVAFVALIIITLGGALAPYQARAGIGTFVRNQKRSWHQSGLATHSVSHESIASSACLAEQISVSGNWDEIINYIKEKFNVVVHDEYNYLRSKTKRWTGGDLNILLHVLENLPQHFFPLKNQIKIMISGRDGGYEKGAAAKFVERRIEIYDDLYIHFRSDYERIGAITHEFGHVFAAELGLLSGKNGWRSLNQWESEGAINYEEFISKYALTENGEDFAESFTAYRYNGAALMRVAPKKYNYLKNRLFLGLEYLSPSTCTDSNFYFQSKRSAKLEYLPESFNKCELTAGRVYFNFAPKDELVKCLKKNIEYKKNELDFSSLNSLDLKHRQKIKTMYETADFPRLRVPGLSEKEFSEIAERLSDLGALYKPISTRPSGVPRNK